VAAINFRSVGRTREQQIASTLVQSPTPIGIKTPLRPGGNNGIFDVHFALKDQVKDNLRNLLLTNWGERLGLYNFGANLRPLTTELVGQDSFDAQATERIKGAVDRWMPYVSLDTFESRIERTDNKNTGIIVITIRYSIPAINAVDQSLEIVLYVI
jgi:phage baseplate assembly protein W